MTRWQLVLLAVALGCTSASDPLYGTRPVPAARRSSSAHAQTPRPQVVLPPQETPPDAPPPAPPAQDSDATPPARPDDAEPIDPVDEQRMIDEEAYEDAYLRQKERLFPEHLGRWVAIVGGRLLPIDARGKLLPAASFEECLKAAEAADAEALHRFVFRIGEEGDVVYSDASALPRNVVGSALKSTFGITATFDASSGQLKWTRGEKSHVFTLDHERMELLLADPLDHQSMGVRCSDSSTFAGYVILDASSGDLLDSEKFEIPGRALLKTSGDPPFVALRRARARVKLRDLALDDVIPVAVWPD